MSQCPCGSAGPEYNKHQGYNYFSHFFQVSKIKLWNQIHPNVLFSVFIRPPTLTAAQRRSRPLASNLRPRAAFASVSNSALLCTLLSTRTCLVWPFDGQIERVGQIRTHIAIKRPLNRETISKYCISATYILTSYYSKVYCNI